MYINFSGFESVLDPSRVHRSCVTCRPSFTCFIKFDCSYLRPMIELEQEPDHTIATYVRRYCIIVMSSGTTIYIYILQGIVADLN